MAGAGKRTFIAGEVLTAAQVNDYLMDQAVMRFSGSAARAASITAPTEGMVTYLDDQNRLEIYDGSAWVIADARSAISGSAQILVSTGAGQMVALPPGSDGQVLTLDSTSSVGMSWETVEAGGAAVYMTIAATGVTALPSPLPAGFYQIQTSTTTTFSDTQWRFVDSEGNLYGATLTGGTGFFSLPVQAASLNITTGTTPFTVLIQEIQGVTALRLAPPTVTGFTWTTVNGGTFTGTTASNAASVGAFNVLTGAFTNMGVASVRTGANIVSGPTACLSTQYKAAIVQANPTGVWSAASLFTAPFYPFRIFTANGTYVAPPWSTTADALIVAGGGGGRGGGTNPYISGGGGAGGAKIVTAIPTTGSVSVVVGAGGGAGGNGSNSSFGPQSTTGGGAGGRGAPALAAASGGSGGGGGSPGTGAAGTPGEGNPGGSSGGGGGGVATAGSNGPNGAGGSGSFFYGVAVAGGGTGGPGPAPGNPWGGGGSAPIGNSGTGNTGSGGGAGYTGDGGGGGSGIVIVKAN